MDFIGKIKDSRSSFIISFFSNLFFRFTRSFRPKRDTGIKNISVISLNKLGDSVFTIPAVKEIINHYKDAEVNIFCLKGTEEIFKLIINNSKIFVLDKNDFLFNYRFAKSKARMLLNKQNPDLIFDLTCNITSAFLLFNSNAREIIGSNEFFYKSIYTHYTKIRKEPHITDIYLDIIKLKFPVVKKEFDNNTFNYNQDGFVLIHPFAGWKAKEWGIEKYLKLAEFLIQKGFVCKFIFEKDSSVSSLISELKKREIPFLVPDNQTDLIKEIKKSLIFIGNDSGPAYLANMLDIPVFIIFGPTNPDYHLPLSGKYEFIQKKIKCSPKENEKLCFTNGGRNGCPVFECMNMLSVNEVKDKLIKFLLDINSVNLKNVNTKKFI